MKIINKLCVTGLVLGGIGCLVFGGMMITSGQQINVSDFFNVKVGNGSFGINFGSGVSGGDIFSEEALDLSEVMTMSEEIQTLDFQIGAAQLFIQPGDSFTIVTEQPCISENQVDGTTWYVEIIDASFSSGNGKIIVTVPKDKRVNLELEVGAGTVDIGAILVGDAAVSIGAGSGTAYSLDMNGTFNIEVGLGSFEAFATYPQNINIDDGLGSVELKLSAPQKLYDITADCGMGSVKAGTVKIDGVGDQEYTSADSEGNISIDCGMGSVNVSFDN